MAYSFMQGWGKEQSVCVSKTRVWLLLKLLRSCVHGVCLCESRRLFLARTAPFSASSTVWTMKLIGQIRRCVAVVQFFSAKEGPVRGCWNLCVKKEFQFRSLDFFFFPLVCYEMTLTWNNWRMTSNAIRGIRRKKSSLSEVKVAVIGAPGVGKSGKWTVSIKKNACTEEMHIPWFLFVA